MDPNSPYQNKYSSASAADSRSTHLQHLYVDASYRTLSHHSNSANTMIDSCIPVPRINISFPAEILALETYAPSTWQEEGRRGRKDLRNLVTQHRYLILTLLSSHLSRRNAFVFKMLNPIVSVPLCILLMGCYLLLLREVYRYFRHEFCT